MVLTIDISKSFTSLKNLRTLDFDTNFYNHYRDTDLNILCGFKDMSMLHSIGFCTYSGDKELFYRIIIKLCEILNYGEILPKWIMELDDNECTLSRL